MGQKVHPYAFRLGIIRSWKSMWFSDRNYQSNLHKDIKLRGLIHEKLPNSGIADIEIQRNRDQVTVIIHTSKPGVIIGRSGANIDDLRHDLQKKTHDVIDVKVLEIRKPELNARLVAENVAQQIEKRISYRRAGKQAMKRAREQGALGIKIALGGRLNGAEIARRETMKDGNIPLHTLRADIDYASLPAATSYGAIGVKVWIYRGLIFKEKTLEDQKQKELHEYLGEEVRPRTPRKESA